MENRDREIERLHRVLDGGRSADALSLESRLKSNEKVIAHQNAQVIEIEFNSNEYFPFCFCSFLRSIFFMSEIEHWNDAFKNWSILNER